MAPRSLRSLLWIAPLLAAFAAELAGAQTLHPIPVREPAKIGNHAPSFPDVLDDGDRFGASVAVLGDLDGDGVDDLAVGANEEADGGIPNRGAVRILYLNPDRTVREERRINAVRGGLAGPLRQNDRFGSAVAALGDLDGDGVPDLAVGAPFDDAGGSIGDDVGALWILLLNADGSVKAERRIREGEGGFQGDLDAGDRFGTSVTALGDLDGDGVPDVAVGAPYDDDALPIGTTGDDHGAVWILFLESDGTVRDEQKISQSVPGPLPAPLTLQDDDRFGFAVDALGDLDGDGLPELAVGTIGDDDAAGFVFGDDRGAVWVLFLAADGTWRAKQKISDVRGGFGGGLDDDDSFGSALASLGDLDGDGIADLAVGASGDDDAASTAGAFWILFLDADGTVRSEAKIANPAATSFAGFATAAESAGDLDGDGVADLLAGAPREDAGGQERGALRLLFLDTSGALLGDEEIGQTSGGLGRNTLDAHDVFGDSVASLGDLDGDGVAELAVGAPGDGGPSQPLGAVWILFPDADGTLHADRTIGAGQGGFGGALDSRDGFGSSVAPLGDLDGDGVADLAVGAPGDDDGGPDRGALWILFLNADGTVKSERKISSTQVEPRIAEDFDEFGSALACLGDLYGDGVPDLAVGASDDDDGSPPGFDRGAVWILFLGTDGRVVAERKISQTSGGFQGTLESSAAFGSAAAALGDVDGDGVTELAVGAIGSPFLFSSSEGSVWILSLSPAGTVRSEARVPAGVVGLAGVLERGDRFGVALAPLGDLDGDGTPDLAVGAYGDDDGGVDHGAVWLLHLRPPPGTFPRRSGVRAVDPAF